MSLVAGIDYSTHAIDVVTIDEDTLKPEWHRYELEGQDAFDRARDVNASGSFGVEAAWIWESCVAVGIEEPRGYGAGHLYRVQGAILASVPGRTLVQPWVPSEWRKAVGLKGNASKEDVAAHVRSRMLYLLGAIYSTRELCEVWAWPQDACDAYCIARATLGAIERTT
jgi:hypothetical protein